MTGDPPPSPEPPRAWWDAVLDSVQPDNEPPTPWPKESRWGFRAGRIVARLFDATGLIVLVALSAVTLVWLGLFVRDRIAVPDSEKPQQSERSTADSTKKPSGEFKINCTGLLSGAPKCTGDLKQAESEDKTAEDDLVAQRAMARWAEGLFWLTLAGLAISGSGIWLVYATLVATRSIGQNENKAYVHAVGATLHVFTRRGLFSRVDHIVLLSVTNVGATPAIRLRAEAKLWVEEAGVLMEQLDPLELVLDQSASTDVAVPNTPVALRFRLRKDRYRPTERGENTPAEGILGATKRVVFRGRVLYDDVFQSRYVSHFHFEYNGAPTTSSHDMTAIVGNLVMFKRIRKRPIAGAVVGGLARLMSKQKG